MRHFIIGTAGHVDHGKTSLIKALTGIDADRLKEEKKRGITIELGFAYIDLPHFERVGIVDVPGHEKFIKNMLAGAGGIDFAMLVVAADEGVMPQTREHLDILKLLDMKHGLVVITKTDLAEPEFVDLVEEEIREEIVGTFLEQAPILRVSSHTGEGVEELRECLDRQLMKLEKKNEKKPFRLPIDRTFTLTGFGTVVTGTVIEGHINLGTECVLYPDEIPVKLRGIQVHSKDAQTAYAGQRAAVNLAGISKESIQRGYVLAPAGSMTATMILDVRLSVLKDSPYSVKNNSRVHLYHGASELLAKVVLMGCDELKPGESGYAQLRLSEWTAAKKGDHFVIRFYSPMITIGGGMILDAVPEKKKRSQEEVVCRGMEIKEKGTDKERLYQTVLESKHAFCTLEQLIKKGDFNRRTAENDCSQLVAEGRILELPGAMYIEKEQEKQLQERGLDLLRDFHKENPFEEGMGIQTFRVRLLGPGREKEADSLIVQWEEKKLLKRSDGCISLYAFLANKPEEDKKIRTELEVLYQEAGFAPPAMETLQTSYEGNRRFRAALAGLLRDKTLIRLDDRYLMDRGWYQKAEDTFIRMTQNGEGITLGQYRDTLDTSRKVALALLEEFDRKRLSIKDGELRRNAKAKK